MTEEPENLTLRYLRRLSARMDEMSERMEAMRLEQHATNEHLAGIHQQFSAFHATRAADTLDVDKLRRRVDRIERRLDLKEDPDE